LEATTMQGDVCPICGGDGRITNSFGGSSATCPACHGSGRRGEERIGFHDVTKTKPSHYRPRNEPQAAKKRKDWPETPSGARLATEVRESESCEEALKAKLIREIIEYERGHAQMTKTFTKKIRRQLRPPPPG
jgi:DnaJ-class molecular chaperone